MCSTKQTHKLASCLLWCSYAPQVLVQQASASIQGICATANAWSHRPTPCRHHARTREAHITQQAPGETQDSWLLCHCQSMRILHTSLPDKVLPVSERFCLWKCSTSYTCALCSRLSKWEHRNTDYLQVVGKPIDCKCESDIFKNVGLSYVPPSMRALVWWILLQKSRCWHLTPYSWALAKVTVWAPHSTAELSFWWWWSKCIAPMSGLSSFHFQTLVREWHSGSFGVQSVK